MMIAKILIPVNKLPPLYYSVPDYLILEIGSLVIIPLKSREILGVVLELHAKNREIKNLKNVTRKLQPSLFISKQTLQFINELSKYYLMDIGSIAKMMLPLNIENNFNFNDINFPTLSTLKALSKDQEDILNKINKSNIPILIKGNLKSDKMDLCFHLIQDYLIKKKQILLMTPEIFSTYQLTKLFFKKFNFKVANWHSNISKKQKKLLLEGIVKGDIRIIIGTRSSVLLPYQNLGLIIILEEHDPSYKQDHGLAYHARDVAILKNTAAEEDNRIKILLVSSTPSLESLYQTDIGKYELIILDEYFRDYKSLLTIINMKLEKLSKRFYLSNTLLRAIKENLVKKEQVFLFLNRRGYAPSILCNKCGYRFMCSYCTAWLVLHKLTKHLECHYCGYKSDIPKNCPSCFSKEENFILLGAGIEKIAEEVQYHFEGIKTFIVSQDQFTNNKKIEDFYKKVQNNEVDVIIGTQIIAKSYNFSNLTLIGVVDADFNNSPIDLRSNERTFQLLKQTSSRINYLADNRGKIFIQTYNPNREVFKALEKDSEELFITCELKNREAAGMPPFTKMVSIILTSKYEQEANNLAKNLILLSPKDEGIIKIFGPSKAFIQKLRSNYRFRVLVISKLDLNLQKFISTWISKVNIPTSCKLKIDFDPYTFF